MKATETIARCTYVDDATQRTCGKPAEEWIGADAACSTHTTDPHWLERVRVAQTARRGRAR